MKNDVNSATYNKNSHQESKTLAGCCGGPAIDNKDACCVKDAKAKAAGKAGCGCGCSATEIDH